MNFPETKLTECDVLVAGADTAGIAAAIAAAQSGQRVVLIDPRIYPLGDITGGLNLIHPPAEIDRFCATLGLDPQAVRAESGPPDAFHPRRLKSACEDRLLACGVRIYYGLAPFAWQEAGGRLHVAVGGKTGTYLIGTRHLVEATVEGHFVPAFVGKKTGIDSDTPDLRRIEFSGVNLELLSSPELEIPEHGRLNWLRGPTGEGHVFVDVPVPPQPVDATHAQRDRAALTKGYSAGDWLRENHPAFAHSRFAGIAEQNLQPGLFSLEPARDEIRSGFWIAGVCGPQGEQLTASIAARAAHGAKIGRVAASDRRTAAPGNGWLPIERKQSDVLVIGGGTCGASAAIAAGENGASTIVAELNHGLGGIGTVGGINSYWFSYRSGHTVRLTHAVRKMQPADGYEAMPHWKMKMWNIETKKHVLDEAAGQAGVEIVAHSAGIAALRQGNVVQGAWLLARDRLIEVRAAVTVDATGDGDFADRAGARYTYGAERSGATMWFTLAPVTKPGTLRSSFTSNLDVRDPSDYTRAILSGRRRSALNEMAVGDSPYDHATYLGTRESRHIHGEVTLTLTDQLRQRRWPDVIAIAFSNHDVKGYSESDWLRLGLIPPNLEIEIPLRALIPSAIDGLLVTGKALSTSSDGLPAIRMQADFENLGYATGVAAAVAALSQRPPRHSDRREIQRRLVKIGNLPATILDRDCAPASSEQAIHRHIAALDDARPLLEYQDMEMGVVHRDLLPFVEICCAKREIAVPALLRELQDLQSHRRLMVALALAWFQQREAGPVLRDHIARHLGGPILPGRAKPIRYAHPPPDQGNMPELAYLLHALALTCDPESIPLLGILTRKLDISEDALRSATAGMFDYVDAICDIAERLGDPRCDPALASLAEHPLWRDKVFRGHYQADWYEERKAFLEILIARARARCGSKAGCEVLISYLEDSRRPLVNHALGELVRITGQSFGQKPLRWRDWLRESGPLPSTPWRGRTV